LATGLLNRRDLITLGARRRNGKTTFVTNLAVAGAVGMPQFIGYEIPSTWRTLLLILEDDAGEYQEKLRKVIGTRDAGGRIKIITKDDFLDAGIRIDVREPAFRDGVELYARQHDPDLIVIDNVAQVIGAEYNDPQRVHELVQFCYRLARTHNAAVILPAHPKKEDPKYRIHLLNDPNQFFESVMGSSHLINSTGSLWGLERSQTEDDQSVFLGGRQRGDGNQGGSHLRLDENGWYSLVDEAQANLPLVLNTPTRQKAWTLLPEPPKTFSFNEGETLVKPAMRSSSTYIEWMKQCRRLKVVLETPDGKLVKASGLKPLGAGTSAEALCTEALSINPNASATNFFATESPEDRTDPESDVGLDGTPV
jgi:hypothetical protein